MAKGVPGSRTKLSINLSLLFARDLFANGIVEIARELAPNPIDLINDLLFL